MQKLSRRVARNSAFGLAAQVTIKLLSFAFSILIVRNLGAQAYGQYAAVLAFGALFISLSDLGLGTYAVREVARYRSGPGASERIGALYGSTLPLRFLLSLIAAALLVTSAWLTGRPPVMVGAIALGALGLIMYSVQGASDSVLAGFERLDLSAAAKVLYQVVFVSVGALALYLGTGYYGLIIANLLGIALMTYACWRCVTQLGVRPKRTTVSDWPLLLRASLPFGIIGLTLGFSYKFDSVLLNVFRGDAETGYYNAAYNLVFSVAILSNILNTSLYPSLAHEIAGSVQPLPGICGRMLRYLMALSLPIAIGTWVLADRIVPFLFTDGYLPTIQALQIVIWVTPLMFASELLGYVVVVGDNERRAARAIVVSTAFSVGLNLMLVPRFGFLAAALTTVLTEAVLVGQYAWMLRALLGQIAWQKALLRPLAAAVAMGGLVFLLRDLPLPVSVAAGALAYGGLLLMLGVLGREELRFARSLIPARTIVAPAPEPAHHTQGEVQYQADQVWLAGTVEHRERPH